MATYKMKTTQKGVRSGTVHPVVFHEGKTYEIEDDLASEFEKMDAIEPSNEEPVEAIIEDESVNLHENWLDKDPAVLRHGELTAAQVIAKDESDKPDPAPVKQVEGKAEGDDSTKTEDDKPEGDDSTTGKSKKSK